MVSMVTPLDNGKVCYLQEVGESDDSLKLVVGDGHIPAYLQGVSDSDDPLKLVVSDGHLPAIHERE